MSKKSSARTRAWARAGIADMTEERYDEFFNLQGGACAICRVRPWRKRLAADHDHKTGELRGLLCSRCNYGIGMFNDTPSLLERAADYLRMGRT